MSSKKATEQALERLHASLADTLSEGVKAVMNEMNQDGGSVSEIKGAGALLNVARQFLKDNGVEGTIQPNTPQGNLLEQMPFEVNQDDQNLTSH